MADVITFLANNYIWFLIIFIILLLSLLGYFIERKKPIVKKPHVEPVPIIENFDEIKGKTIKEMTEQAKPNEPEEIKDYDSPLIVEDTKENNTFDAEVKK